MELPNFYSLIGSTLMTLLLLRCANTQDTQSYYFASPSGQNRFVPSSSFPANRQSSQAAYLSGSRSASSGAFPQPGSYQEQLLFISNDSKQQEQQQAPAQPLTSAGLSSFSAQTRNPDFYDISPRPFGVPNNSGSANGFTRSKAIRPASSSSGFVPQNVRSNVPHQQTQFLSHFNEPNTSASGRPSFGNGLSGSAARPLGNGAFTPSRNRASSTSYSTDTGNVQLPPSQSVFKNSRNRFQSNSAAVVSTEAPLSTSSKRFNRFGAGRTHSSKPTSAQSNSPAEASSQRPSATRTNNKGNNGVRGFTPRRPVFISREINEPVNLVKEQRPFFATGGRLKYDHEKLLRQQAAATSALVAANNTSGQSDEYEDVQTSDVDTAGASHELSLEKLELLESIETTTLPALNVPTLAPRAETTVSSDDYDTTAISKVASDSKDGKETVTAAEGEVYTTNRTPEYEYEYVEEDESTEVPTKKTNSLSKALGEEETTSSVQPMEALAVTTAAPRTTPNFDNTESTADMVTTALETSTEPMFKDHDHSHEEQQYDSDADYEEEEYDEEEGEDEHDEGDASSEGETTQHSDKDSPNREVISVVTTKSVVNGSTAFPASVTPSSTTLSGEEETIFNENNMKPAVDEPVEKPMEHADNGARVNETSDGQSVSNTTESYVVIASIQTSRSINGARFLPFPAIEQEETKQTLSELERKIHGQKSGSLKNAKDSSSEEPNDSGEETTESALEKEMSSTSVSSTESIIDKLDRVQSELSSGLLSGKYPILSGMDVSTQATTTTGSRFRPNIRKFQPKTTAASKVKVHHFDESEMDELAGLLPAGFKPRSSYKNRKITTTTTTTSTTAAPESEASEQKKPGRNSTISRSFKNNAVIIQDVALAGLLPKGYKIPTTTEAAKSVVKDIFSKLKFEDDLDKLLPKDYKEKISSTSKPEATVVGDISKFLPPDYKMNTSSTTKKPIALVHDDISKFLPAGYKPPAEEDDSDKIAGGIVTLKADDISKFLPPGYKLNANEKKATSLEPEKIDVSSLLPKGFKPNAQDTSELPMKIDIEKLAESTTAKTTSSSLEASLPADPATTAATGFKVVFPKGIHKRLGSHRLTTPRTHESAEGGGGGGGNSPAVVIKKGPPTRATTEFTGWPTPSTTPISIEKLLEQARTVSINFEDLLSSSSTSTTTTSTTTTTTTTPRPTKPGHCTTDCDLAATIKIVGGVAWRPELLDHNTVEWKNLAREVEEELNEVYSNAPQLRNWYRKVRIDSFSKGSVLVDYYVELANITQDVNTLEIKKLFHEALTQAPMESQLPHKPETENETDSENAEGEPFPDVKEEKLIKEAFVMGKYVIDPVATDFSVIPKSPSPTVEYAEEDLLIPQWAIVVIVIGVGSLIFVVIFGVTVLLNRQKRAKKTPIPLTNDMLNELKINHMGGADNYGVDDFYNIDDAWNDTKQPIKPKRFTNSLNDSSGSNIYDSWRSTRHGDYLYDSQKGDSLKRSHHSYPNASQQHHHQHQHQHQQEYQQGYGHQYPDAFADAHQMYTYNNHASRTRYPRDYDPDF